MKFIKIFSFFARFIKNSNRIRNKNYLDKIKGFYNLQNKISLDEQEENCQSDQSIKIPLSGKTILNGNASIIVHPAYNLIIKNHNNNLITQSSDNKDLKFLIYTAKTDINMAHALQSSNIN